ncbi:MAG TPA: aconitate hydratase AcnA [Phycisphaerae bacterium]|nr:aconitate hydratase AcnA [Phycisphaerae bacterium]
MTSANIHDPFKARSEVQTPLGKKFVYRLDALSKHGPVDNLPFSIKVLLEAALRHCDDRVVMQKDVLALVAYEAKKPAPVEIPFMPGRVVLQDFTGVPAVVDLAAMRAAMVRMKGDPKKVNPLVPCDLVIDHSVQVDAFNSGEALQINSKLEFERNHERYLFLKWGQQAFNNFRVVPPATGIVHQVNLEYLAKVVWEKDGVLYPDSLVGTDSHTTMINGLGVVGWGVGGIEAEAVMLDQPIYMLLPEVVGFRLNGKLREGCTATDLVLTVTQMLRKHGVVDKFVEFHGPGLAEMSVADRATIGNMAPEYGATIGFFPIDDQTLTYLRLTGRDEKLIQTVEQYAKLQGLWRDDSRKITYTSNLELDLETVEPSLAGPRRPQDRVALSLMKTRWETELSDGYGKLNSAEADFGPSSDEGAAAVSTVALPRLDPGFSGVPVEFESKKLLLKHGAVVIAAITSCTNTSNPSVMIAAGLVAQKAAQRGLTRQPWVKTSLAPGSKVVMDYLAAAGLVKPLEQCGFYLVGYGCTTCIGNSGPLPEPISKAINENDLVAAAVLSGNRNFEGRINPDVKANYLASPPLVVAYALAGTVDIDLTSESLGKDKSGKPAYLKDIWPSQKEIAANVAKCVNSGQFHKEYAEVFQGAAEWKAVKVNTGDQFEWDSNSTYIQEPPFFENLSPTPAPIASIKGARVLAYLGDSVTTDHISPAGSIKKSSPAGQFLIAHGVQPEMFNSYGARRGDYRVMTRGTFANTRIKNKLAPGTEGGVTTDFLDNAVKPIYDAAVHYKEKHIPLIVLAGKDYGMGSSRDWAAKGTFLLGVHAVIAESFERIHRSNLVGMGVLPLTFKDGQNAERLGLSGHETFDVDLPADIKPRQDIKVLATKADGSKVNFVTTCRIDTPVEVDYYRNGGILHTVLRRMAAS